MSTGMIIKEPQELPALKRAMQNGSLKKRLLTIQETSVYLGRSVPSIRELIWAGKLPIVREGKRIHLDIFDLNRWIEQRKTTYSF